MQIERRKGDWLLSVDQQFAEPLDTVFGFFADAGNLEAITPPWLNFKIITPQPIEMRVGALIQYRIKLHGIPIRWKTEIPVWEPPFRFVDRQISGPYTKWIHEHTFEETAHGTLVRDRVEYSVFGGSIIHSLFVKGDLEKIFTYRQQQLATIFHEVSSEHTAAAIL